MSISWLDDLSLTFLQIFPLRTLFLSNSEAMVEHAGMGQGACTSTGSSLANFDICTFFSSSVFFCVLLEGLIYIVYVYCF